MPVVAEMAGKAAQSIVNSAVEGSGEPFEPDDNGGGFDLRANRSIAANFPAAELLDGGQVDPGHIIFFFATVNPHLGTDRQPVTAQALPLNAQLGDG